MQPKILSTTVSETGAESLAVDAGWSQGITYAVMVGLLTAALFVQSRIHVVTGAAAIVDKGHPPAAKARIKDLEVA